MVARPDGPRRIVTDTAGGVFSWWRRALHLILQPGISAARVSPAMTAGFLGLAIGAIGSGFVTGAADGIALGVRTGLALPIWAGIRLLVMISAARNTSKTPRDLLIATWGWSLVPFAGALTPGLHAIAFIVSAALAWLVLEQSGVSRRIAISLVGWGYGFQIAVSLAVWLARNFLLAGRIVFLN